MSDQLGAFNLCDPDYGRAIESISAAGFRHIALYCAAGRVPYELETMTDAQARGILSDLAAKKLKPVAAGGGSNVLTPEGLNLFLRKLEGAARLGVGVFDTGSLTTKDKTPAVIEEETQRFVENMRRAGDVAARLGIVICLETHGGLTGTVPSCLTVMRRLGHSHVRVGYDPANIRYYEGASPLERLGELIPFIGHVHAKDQVGGKDAAVFPTVGKGEVPYPEILATLRRGGYPGFVSVERAHGDTPEQRAQELKDARAYLVRHFG